MTSIPVIAFAAYSGTGKTTLIEKLIVVLQKKGLRLAVLKHDGHRFEIDHEGKDSWRFTQAGADVTIISSEEQTAYVEQGELSLERLPGMVHNVDLILVEGYKNRALPQIGIARKETGKSFTADISRFIVLVTDLEVETDIPCFGLEDIEGIAGFIMERIAMKNENDFTHFNEEGRAKMVDVGEKPESRRHKRETPSMDQWLREAKADPSAEKAGMYLTHNGVVRGTANAQVREGAENAAPVSGMVFSYDQGKVECAVSDTYKLPGIYYVRVWLNEGELKVGEDIMCVLIGGDIRPHVVDGLQYLVGSIKNECVVEKEIAHEAETHPQ